MGRRCIGLDVHREFAQVDLPRVPLCRVSRVLGREGGFGCPAVTRRKFAAR
jgi:hypothetical protein